MKIIPLVKFCDLYAGTWDQKALLDEIRTVYGEVSSVAVINSITQHMLPTSTPSGEAGRNDNVIARLRTNEYEVDLVLGYNTEDGVELASAKYGYHSSWAGALYQIAFKHRAPDAEKYYEDRAGMTEDGPTMAFEPSDALEINLNDIFDHELGGHGPGARSTMCAIVQRAQRAGEWVATEASMVNTLANISDRFETLRRHYAEYHATLIIEKPVGSEVATAKWSVKLGEPKPGMTFKSREALGERFGQPMYQTQRHPQDRWPDLTNEGIVELLKCYALTQVTPFPLGVPTHVLPQGLDLLQLIQLRLGGNGPQPFGYNHGPRPFGPSSHYHSQLNAFNGGGGQMFNNGQQGFGYTRESYVAAMMASEALKMSTEVTIELTDSKGVFLEPIALHFRDCGVINQDNVRQENLALSLRFNDIRVLLMQATHNNPNLFSSAVKNLVYVQRPKHELPTILRRYVDDEYAGWMLVGRSDVAESDPMFVIPGRVATMQDHRPFPIF